MLTGVLLLPLAGGVQAAEYFNPFMLASRGAGDFVTKVQETKAALSGAGFEILGEYSPYSHTFVDNTDVIVVTNAELKNAATRTRYGGFAAPWRVAVTQTTGGEIQIAYANPPYIASAYRLDTDLAGVSKALKAALGAMEPFGSNKGLTARKLGRYHYTFGMEYFDDVYQLAKYDSHRQAVAALEKNLAAGVAGVTKVYRLDLSNDVTVFGVARKAPDESELDMDEAHIMGVVDFDELKGTAYLPYEIMVDGTDVVALNMRFRMAVHYPDLKMMGKNSFMTLMSSPGAIQKALTAAAGGTDQ
jgi:uncharacterized protein (DUF302 family)